LAAASDPLFAGRLMSTIKTVGVIGAGTMGNGIAQACAVAGIPAIMIDVAAVQKGAAAIAASLDRLVKKEKLTADAKAKAVALVRGGTDYALLKDADFVIEAATERVDLKLDILRKVDAIARPGVIVASNTSSISITQLAAVTKRAERFLGMHFFNP